jgi:hypothetical protein
MLREQVVARFTRRGLTPPDHLTEIGFLVGMGYTSQMILAAVDHALETRGVKFTTMNYITMVLSARKEKYQQLEQVKTETPKQKLKHGSEEYLRSLLELFKKQGYWEITQSTGMQPGTPGCLVSKELLAEYGLPPTPPYPHDIKRK